MLAPFYGPRYIYLFSRYCHSLLQRSKFFSGLEQSDQLRHTRRDRSRSAGGVAFPVCTRRRFEATSIDPTIAPCRRRETPMYRPIFHVTAHREAFRAIFCTFVATSGFSILLPVKYLTPEIIGLRSPRRTSDSRLPTSHTDIFTLFALFEPKMAA